MKNITYHYTTAKPPKVSLRGKGMSDPDVHAIIKPEGFEWVFSRMRKKVLAWQAEISVQNLTGILITLKKMGYNVKPSDKLAPGRWLYLDEPVLKKDKKSTEVRVFQEYGFDNLVAWLSDNGYHKLKEIEQPGDFAVMGEVITVWIRDNDLLYRFIFNGDAIENISKVDPNKTTTEAITVVTVYNVTPRVEIEKVAAKKTGKKKKQRFFRQKDTHLSSNVFDLMQSVADIETVEEIATSTEPLKYTQSQARILVKRFPIWDKNHPLYKMVDWSADEKTCQ